MIARAITHEARLPLLTHVDELRTRLIVRCFSSSGSFHGNTVISAFGASEATSIEVCSGCPGTSSGNTSIGVRQFLMKSRDTLYRKSG